MPIPDAPTYLPKYFDPAELRAELARRRWPKKRLALRIGKSPTLVSMICSGALRPSRAVAASIAAELGPAGAARVFSKKS
jgi:hypothetical protein